MAAGSRKLSPRSGEWTHRPPLLPAPYQRRARSRPPGLPAQRPYIGLFGKARTASSRVAVLDAADESFDRGEGDIWPVTEDGVTCAGQAHKTGCVSGEPPVEVLRDGEWADRVVFAREDQ